MLLVFFLQYEGVCPILQRLAKQSHIVTVYKGQHHIKQDTQLMADVHNMSRPGSDKAVAELPLMLIVSFQRFSIGMLWQGPFDFGTGRSRSRQGQIAQAGMALEWHVGDPIDTNHNVAANCTGTGRQRNLKKMRHNFEKVLRTAPAGATIVPARGCQVSTSSAVYV